MKTAYTDPTFTFLWRIPIQDPKTHALLRGTLPSRPNEGSPPSGKRLQNKEFSTYVITYIIYRSLGRNKNSWKIKMQH